MVGGDVEGVGSVVSTTVGGDAWAAAESKVSSPPSELEHAPRTAQRTENEK